MVLKILRAAFILLFVSVTLLYILSYQAAALFRGLRPSLTPGQIDNGVPFSTILAMFGIAFGIALAISTHFRPTILLSSTIIDHNFWKH